MILNELNKTYKMFFESKYVDFNVSSCANEVKEGLVFIFVVSFPITARRILLNLLVKDWNAQSKLQAEEHQAEL